ncbi:MAG: methyltransferase domain-containing protein [Opitutales bacterium]|nr:methyltransferase domain-containing protein [Opitutales bacterium]
MSLIPDFSIRSSEHELMDDPDCDPRKLLRTVDQFKSINRLVSRYKFILSKWVLDDMQERPQESRHLVDMGAGGCDIDVWLLKAAEKHGLKLHITACDYDANIVAHAREVYGKVPGLEIKQTDLLKEPPKAPVDYVFGNHFLHHLAEEQIIELLKQWFPAVRRRMVFSDLHRAPAPYWGYALLSLFYPRSFARYDGLLSIRKGFKKDELSLLTNQALPQAKAEIHHLSLGRLLLSIDAKKQ